MDTSVVYLVGPIWPCYHILSKKVNCYRKPLIKYVFPSEVKNMWIYRQKHVYRLLDKLDREKLLISFLIESGNNNWLQLESGNNNKKLHYSFGYIFSNPYTYTKGETGLGMWIRKGNTKLRPLYEKKYYDLDSETSNLKMKRSVES